MTLEKITQKLQRLNHIKSVISWDEAVMMPIGGSEDRAGAMAEITGLIHDNVTHSQIPVMIQEARKGQLTAKKSATLNELELQWKRATALPSEFVEKLTIQCVKTESLWRGLRPKNDWQGFKGDFAKLVALVQEEANFYSQKLGVGPYQALVDNYGPGVSVANIDKLFDQLRSKLPNLINKAIESQPPFKKLTGDFPVEAQKSFGKKVMEILGFDFNQGRLDESHHPFCGGVPSDIRITNRYYTDSLVPAYQGIVHETGHGLYGMNLPREPQHWPAIEARGMGVHESQSLFFEKQIGLSPEFLSYMLPLMQEYFSSTSNIAELSTEDLFHNFSQVERSLIRVDADEATYPLHVILRYEIERGLVERQIKAEDVPSIWNEKIKGYLGLSTEGNFKDGCMQDVHWPSGTFGYFPSYALGAIMAAQLFKSHERVNPSIRSQLKSGDLSKVKTWLDDKIWKQASFCSFDELILSATGESLGTESLEAHLTKRYVTRN